MGQFNGDLKAKVLQQVYNGPLGGHSSYLKTFHRLKKGFYWSGMGKDLKQYIREWDVCQKLKNKTCYLAGLLQPFSILERPWLVVSMDFVKGLPKSQMKTMVFIMVDRLTKYAHFIPISHPYTAARVANLYMQFVFKLHGMPSSFVSDNDPIFTSKFWLELMRLQGVVLAMSSSYHP